MGFFSSRSKNKSSTSASSKSTLSRTWHGVSNAKRSSSTPSREGLAGNSSTSFSYQIRDGLKKAKRGSKGGTTSSDDLVPPLLEEKEYLKQTQTSSSNCGKGLSKSAHGLSRSAHGLSRSLHGIKRSLHGFARKISGADKLDLEPEQPRILKSCLKKPSDLMNVDDVEGACQSRPQKNVVFDEVHVREYVASYCHHPCVRDGLAVALGWNYCALDAISIDEYEAIRPPKAPREQLLLDYMSRVKIVRSGGASMKEIRKAMELTRRARNARLITLRKVREEDYMNFEMAEEHRRLQLGKRCVEEYNGQVIDT